MSKQTFLKGAFTLMFASILVKTLGFTYQIMIVRLIGTEGIGIFNMVYPLYVTALVFTSAGLPLAVTKYVSEALAGNNHEAAGKIMGMSVFMVLLFTSLGSVFILLFSPHIIHYLYADPRVIPSFLILVPALVIVSVSSVIRSFFQGMQDMRPTAYNQLLEQIIRFFSGLLLVYILYPFGLVWSAVGLALGVLFSELGGFFYITALFRRTFGLKRIIAQPSLPVVAKLLSFGIPVTVTRVLITAVTALEASLIPKQLIKAGSSLSEATSFYGELSGVAFTLLMVPSTFSFSLSTSLMPSISEAQSSKQKALLRQRVTDAIGITLLAGVPSAIFLYSWGPAMTKLLFNAGGAGPVLQILACGSVFLYLSQTSIGILQGMGNVKTVFFTTLVGGILRLSGIYFWGAHPVFRTTGIACSYVASFLMSSLLNVAIIKIKTGFHLDYAFLLRLIIAAYGLIKLLQFSAGLVDNALLLIAAVLFNGSIFFLFLWLLGDRYTRLVIQQFQKYRKKAP